MRSSLSLTVSKYVRVGLKPDISFDAGHVHTDDIYYVDGGRAFFGSKKISLEERTEIVRWAEAVVEKVSA